MNVTISSCDQTSFPFREILYDYASTLLICIVPYLTLSVITYHLFSYLKIFPRVDFPSNERILFLIAHPDDESMFFGPTIVHLTEKNPDNIFLLCLSAGDYRKEGAKRIVELWEACKRLKISKNNILLIKSDLLPDHPNISWDSEVVGKIVGHHVEALDINRIVTFDEKGVSGHLNHKALYESVRQLLAAKMISCRLFALESVAIPRKYSGFFDVPLTVLLDDYIFLSSWKQRQRVLFAMHAHTSQLVWFRQLYIFFSRYLFINSFKEVCTDFGLN